MATSQLPHLTLVTFSGAHATGKSTLLDDLRQRLQEVPDTSVWATQSCSQILFQRIQEGSVQLPVGSRTPRTYADINGFGLRAFFQRALPDALAFEIESTMLRALDAPVAPKTVLLVDRWFADILAYTVTESKDEPLHAEVRDLCRTSWESTLPWLLDRALTLRIVNVFVPVKVSMFAVPLTTKFRATGDREAWERVCLERWDEVPPGRRAMLKITTSDRRRRVLQVLKHLRAGQPDPATA